MAACTQPLAVLVEAAAFRFRLASDWMVPLLLKDSVALPAASAMLRLPAAYRVPLLLTELSARTVAVPLSASVVPLLLKPLLAVRLSESAFSVPALVTVAPDKVRVLPDWMKLALWLVRLPVLASPRSLVASSLPLLVVLEADRLMAWADCRVPLLVSAPDKVMLSVAL